VTSPVSHIGLIYSGTDLQESDLTIFFEIDRGLDEVPSVRGTDTVVPALAGRIERNRVNDVLPIVLRGFVRADPTLTDATLIRADFRTRMRALRLLFAPDGGRQDLIATLEDGDTATISALPMNINTVVQIGSEYWSGSIELEGYDDWEYGTVGS
jgi:hypothetical protein